MIHINVLVREPVIGLIKWLRPKGLKLFSYVECVLNSKIKLLKKSAGTQKCYALQVYNSNHVISAVKCKLWQQTIYNDQFSI